MLNTVLWQLVVYGWQFQYWLCPVGQMVHQYQIYVFCHSTVFPGVLRQGCKASSGLLMLAIYSTAIQHFQPLSHPKHTTFTLFKQPFHTVIMLFSHPYLTLITPLSHPFHNLIKQLPHLITILPLSNLYHPAITQFSHRYHTVIKPLSPPFT